MSFVTMDMVEEYLEGKPNNMEEILKELKNRYAYSEGEFLATARPEDVCDWLKEKLTVFEQLIRSEYPRLNDVSAWKNYGKERKYDVYLKEEFLKKILPNYPCCFSDGDDWDKCLDTIIKNAEKDGVTLIKKKI